MELSNETADRRSARNSRTALSGGQDREPGRARRGEVAMVRLLSPLAMVVVAAVMLCSMVGFVLVRQADDVVPQRDGWYNFLDWVCGCVLVYMTLFGVGKLIFGEPAAGLIFLAVAAAAAAVIIWDLSRRGWQTLLQ